MTPIERALGDDYAPILAIMQALFECGPIHETALANRLGMTYEEVKRLMARASEFDLVTRR